MKNCIALFLTICTMMVMVSSSAVNISAETTEKAKEETCSELSQQNKFPDDNTKYLENEQITENISLVKEPTKANLREQSKAEETVQYAKLNIDISGGVGFTISINGSAPNTQGTSYSKSTVVVGSNITIVPTGKQNSTFFGWRDKFDRIVSYDPIYTFDFGTSTSLTAIYNVPIEGRNKVVFINNELNQIVEQQLYSATDTIKIPADTTYVYGYTFLGWDKTEATIKEELAQGRDVLVTSKFESDKKAYNVDVVNGTVIGTKVNEKYLGNSQIKLIANTPESGKKFAYWQDKNGIIKSYNEIYKTFLFADEAYMAVYTDITQTTQKTSITEINNIELNTKRSLITFTLDWYVPTDFTVVQAGILIGKNFSADESRFILGGSTEIKTGTSMQTTNTGTFVVNLKELTNEDTIKARSFVMYKDLQGNVSVAYGKVYTTRLYSE